MASEGNPGTIPANNGVQPTQAVTSTNLPASGGKPLPSGGKIAPNPYAAIAATGTGPATATVVTKTPVPPATDPQVLVQNLNKFLNDSGRPDQFRLDPASGGKLIQQINPSSGAVIGEFSVTEFPALARSVGVAGLLVDSVA